MSTTKKDNRLNLPIGFLKQILTQEFGDASAETLDNRLDIENLALTHASREELAERYSLRLKKRSSTAADQENSQNGVRRELTGNSAITHQSCMTTGRSLTQDDYNQGDELFNAVQQDYGLPDNRSQSRVGISHRSVEHRDSTCFPFAPAEPIMMNAGCITRLRSTESLGPRSTTSIEYNSRYNDIIYENERRPATQAVPYSSVMMNRSPRTSDLAYHPSSRYFGSISKKIPTDDWGAITPANETSVAETPILKHRGGVRETSQFAPSCLSSRNSMSRSSNRTSGLPDYSKVIHTGMKNSVARIVENIHENDDASTARYVTPGTGRLTYNSHQCHSNRSNGYRYGGARRSPGTQSRRSCNPGDAVPYNPNPARADPSDGEIFDGGTGDRSRPSLINTTNLKRILFWIWRWKYTVTILTLGIWLFGFPYPSSLSALGGFSNLLPTSKSTGTLPTFCQIRRADNKDCIPCPRRALCYEGRAECPTYYALEKVSGEDWECKSYKDELDRIAQEGFSRVIKYLRRIEKPAGCGHHVMSNPESRRDVLHLFDNILLPMLDERQKGLKDGLLQMYLTILADEEKLRELNVEKDGGLHVTLASVMTKTRLTCYLPTSSHSLIVILVAGIVGLVYLNFWLK